MKKFILAIAVAMMLLPEIHGQIEMIWTSGSIAVNPESIVYDPVRNRCYVSNFGQTPADGMNYNDDFISCFDMNGKVLEREFVTGLTAPTGLSIHNDMLYIVERFGVVKFDLRQNRVETRYRININRFLNDVAVDDDENIYVTVSDTNIIFRISDGRVEKWLEGSEFHKSNAILADNDRIIIGVCSDNTIRAVSRNDRKVSELVRMESGSGVIDGLQKCGEGFLLSHYEGIVWHLRKDGSIENILDTSGEGVFCADFAWVEDQGLLIAPTLKNNLVSLYRYKPKK